MDAPKAKYLRTRIPVGWTRGAGDPKQTNLALSQEAHDRLDMESLGSKATKGTIVDALICRHLRRYTLQDRGASVAEMEARAAIAAAAEGRAEKAG